MQAWWAQWGGWLAGFLALVFLLKLVFDKDDKLRSFALMLMNLATLTMWYNIKYLT